MGLIQRQAFKNSLLKYTGVAVSALATILIYSNHKEIYGLYSFLFSGAILLSPIITLGGGNIGTKFHPNNQNDDPEYEGLLFFLLSISVLGSITFLLIFFSFRSSVEELLMSDNDDPLLKEYLLWVIPFAILVALRNLIGQYTANHGRIVIQELLGNFLNRITTPFLVLAAGLSLISLDTYMTLVLLTYAISIFGLLMYLLLFEKQIFKLPEFLHSKEKLLVVTRFGLFSILNSLASIIAVRIDTLMVGKMIDLTNAGAYTILLFLTNIILIPRDSIFQISGPIVARNVDTPNMDEVNRIYKSSSLILLFAGLLISGLILLNIADLIAILPKSEEFIGFFGVTAFLCLAHIFDMTTSVNTHIIIYSKYYKINLFMILIMAAANIAFNLYFIPLYGLVGAALSTFLSLLIYNLAKLFFIQRVYQMQPFSLPSLYILLAGTALYGATYMIPAGPSHWFNIVWKSLLFGGSFCAMVYYFKWSPQFNQLIQKLKRQMNALF